MNRSFGAAFAVVAALFVSFWFTPSGRVQAETKPNVLLIITDDHREGLSQLPKTQQWFSDGINYENAYATTPLCCPSRASIMTGQYAHNHLVKTNEDSTSLVHEMTIQAFLKNRGYRTALYGKYLNGSHFSEIPSYFDEWARPTDAGNSKHVDARWNVNGATRDIPGYNSTVIGDFATEFLRRAEASNDTEPWYLYLAPSAVHSPFIPEAQYSNAAVAPWSGNPAVAETDRSDKPAYVRKATCGLACGQTIRIGQYRMLLSVDDMVDRVFGELQAQGELADTLVFFMSDNGYMWGEHGLEGKMQPYTESIQVPMMARWPGHLAAGTDKRRVANIDIAPTVLAALGEPMPSADGKSLLDSSWSRQSLLHEEWGGSVARYWASLRADGWQYIEHYNPKTEQVAFKEYYNLTADPWQLSNRFQSLPPDQQASLSSQLAQARTCVGSGCP